MTDKVVVLSTCGSSQEAARIARSLVEDRLAACVNVTSPVRSLYRWEGRVCDEEEFLLVVKTSRTLFDRVRRAIEKLHSYHVPEVVCLPMIDASPNYLNWLTASLQAEPDAPPRRATRKRK